MNIPKGYEIQFYTWENDGDHYKTQIMYGLTREDVYFFVDLASKFMSTYGNDSIDPTVLTNIFKELLEKHSNVSDIVRDLFDPEEMIADEDIDEESDIVVQWQYESLVENVLGWTDDYLDEPYFCRVIESMKIYYHPDEVVDVTKEFLK
jgi:hypothetical protein